jgi:hypothetical protein
MHPRATLGSGQACAGQGAGAPLSWKYSIYHGGLRLWEVRRSLVLADHERDGDLYMEDSDRASAILKDTDLEIGLHPNLSEAFTDPKTPRVRARRARLLPRFHKYG